MDCLSHDLEKVTIVKWVDVRVYYFSLTLRGSSVGPALSLFPNGHWFESPHGHRRFTRSLTSSVIKKKKSSLFFFADILNGCIHR